MAQSKTTTPRPQRRTWLDSFRQFLTPAVWKQAHQAWHRPQAPKPPSPTTPKPPSAKRACRWELQPLVMVLLVLSWCSGESQAERFEAAKAFCIACRPKRRRPGRTRAGFDQALARLPLCVLRALAAGLRQQLVTWLPWEHDGFIPLGCDGSRLTCPRSQELEQRLCGANPKGSAPTIWLTALVHLRLGVPWCWRWGKGTADERWHLTQMIALLPAATLLVADAGFIGYELLALLNEHVSFLIRGCSNAPLYSPRNVQLDKLREGQFLYWPQQMQKKGLAPVPVRVLRLRTKGRDKTATRDVWLLTNVLDPQRLTRTQASQYYRWRWENEGLFRTYKQTLRKAKLASRTVALLHREAEGSLLALQLLLAQGVLALPRQQRQVSPRQVLLEIRREIGAAQPKRRKRFGQRLRRAQREQRVRTSAKERRVWPRRVPHKAAKAPRFLKLTDEQKLILAELHSVPSG